MNFTFRDDHAVAHRVHRHVRRLSLAAGICAALSLTTRATANWFTSLFEADVDIISVTDMTAEGRAYPHASAEKPVYYMIVNAGQRTFGPLWAGEKVPATREALKWMMTAMAEQGYRLADNAHPPTQLFVFGWGMMMGNAYRPALQFLGGDKLDLKWEGQQYVGGTPILTIARQQRLHGLNDKVWQMAESNLFLGVVRSYTIETAKGGKPVQLWETRFACPAHSGYLADVMPVMIKIAAVNLGRESTVPVSVDATDAFRGRVNLGELKILGTGPDAQKTSSPEPLEKR